MFIQNLYIHVCITLGCEDCGAFYDKECTQHRIQLIFDKPVLSRAWASLPASYLFVNKITVTNEGETGNAIALLGNL